MPKQFYVRAGLSALGGAMALAMLPSAHAKPPAKARRAGPQLASVTKSRNIETGYEKSLLGVRILQSYKNVLARWGQPDRIFRADEYLDIHYDFDAKGKPTGGVTDVTSGGDINGGNTMGSSDNPPADNADPQSPDAPAADAANGPMGGGLNGGSQDKPPETFRQSGGYTWVYFFHKEKKAFIFSFNGGGRVLEISEMGLGAGMPTKRGINLNSALGDVYNTYGWPDTVQENKEDMQLFYDIKHHCQFDVYNNRVTAISVVLAEGMKIHKIKDKNGSGGGSGGGAPGGGGSGPNSSAAPPPKRAPLGG